MEPQYTGFWSRLGAAVVDSILVGSILMPIPIAYESVAFHYLVVDVIHKFAMRYWTIGFFDSMFVIINPCVLIANIVLFKLPSPTLLVVFVLIVFNWLYHARMESSSKQATIGKMLLKIKVTDLVGQRISFWRATVRHFSKIFSTLILLVGYMMAGWTQKKQALHDIIAETLVVRR